MAKTEFKTLDEVFELMKDEYRKMLVKDEYRKKITSVEELKEKIHILNEANMKLENELGSLSDFYTQKISVLESKNNELQNYVEDLKLKLGETLQQLGTANLVIKQVADSWSGIAGKQWCPVFDYIERFDVK